MNMNLERHRKPTAWAALALLGLIAISGCERSADPVYMLNTEAEQFELPMQLAIRKILNEQSGTPQAPKMMGDKDFDEQKLKRGAEVYNHRCVQCHGVTGDGNGPVATELYPRPRDYRRGTFKFTSTPYGAKPRREDLIHTLERGIPGTSMPSFARLSRPELEAVTDYVIALSKRGELEFQLVQEADPEEPEFDQEIVDELIEYIVDSWKQAEFQEVQPLTPRPEFTMEDVEAGRALFTNDEVGCLKCHGEDGRGQTKANVVTPLKDTWGHDARAADLTSGILRGGSKPIDIYRRIYNGINGTPMPGFSTSAKIREDPELVWKLVAYVLNVSGQRRAGEIPPVGEFTFAPYPIQYDASVNQSSESGEEESSEE